MPIPLMSVTFPTRNRADLLAHALESVLTVGTANADRCTIEILVIDDGSTDHTAQVVRRYPVQLLQTQNAHGASAARNVGLAQARGDFMTFLDDDDLRLPANVSTLLTWLERHPAAGAAWGLAQRTTPDLAPLGAPLPEGMAVSGWIFEQLLSFWPQLGAVMVRAEAARGAGRFDESLLAGEDWDWLLRIAERWPIGWIETPVLLFRQRATTDVAMMQWRLRDAVLVFRRHTSSLPLLQRLRLERILLRHRGWFASHSVMAAKARVQAGKPADVRYALRCAWRASPPHTLRLLWVERALLHTLLATA